MNLIINGETKSFDGDFTLEKIIEQLKIKDKVMACAVNMEIVKKENWSTYTPKNDDTLELLQFVGGG